jgi:hypothetical protein
VRSVTLGAQAAGAWYSDRGFRAPTHERWNVEISLATLDVPAPEMFDDRIDSRFHVDIYGEEWGFFFCHGGRTSWIRVTDVPFVHGRDEFELLSTSPRLGEIGELLRGLESRHRILFRRKQALVKTNLPSAESSIRRWIEAL